MTFTPTLSPLDGSMVLSLAGQASATEWRLVGPDSGQVIDVPDASHRHSARTMVVVQSVPTTGVLNPSVGTLISVSEIGEVDVGDSQFLILEHPRQRVRIYGLRRGRARVVATIYLAEAMLAGRGDGDFSSIVTIHLELRHCEEGPLVEPPKVGALRALTMRLDEFGFVLVDETKARKMLGAYSSAIESAGGIMEAFGASELGEAMIDAGAMIPVWGMRPWVYRLASVQVGDVCPFGREVLAPVVVRNATFADGARLIPGSELRGRCHVDFSRWPVLDLGCGDSLAVSAYVSGGFEPINPVVPVGIVPTFVVLRIDAAAGPLNSQRYPLVQSNPIEAYDAHATRPEEPLVAVSASDSDSRS